MAKKETKTVETVKEAKPVMFYADRVKYARAQTMVTKKESKTLKEAYDKIGGTYTEGYGIEAV